MQEDQWTPKTSLGKMVAENQFTGLDEVLSKGYTILESEIVDYLVSDLDREFLLIGQARGKFGGGQRRPAKNTQLVTRNGNIMSFGTCAVVGNKDGLVGIGFGKSRDTNPAKDKALRNAKLSILRVKRGCGSWECSCNEPHTVPFKVSGRSGSLEVTLMPAPRGTGLVCHDEIAKILELAGVKDVWSKVRGKTSTRVNLIKATYEALKNLSQQKVVTSEKATIVSGPLSNKANE